MPERVFLSARRAWHKCSRRLMSDVADEQSNVGNEPRLPHAANATFRRCRNMALVISALSRPSALDQNAASQPVKAAVRRICEPWRGPKVPSAGPSCRSLHCRSLPRPRPPPAYDNRVSTMPPSAASSTTNQGDAFHAISATKHAKARVKSRMLPIALVNTGE